MAALAERLRLELDSSDRKNLVGSQIIPDNSPYRTNGGLVLHMYDYGLIRNWANSGIDPPPNGRPLVLSKVTVPSTVLAVDNPKAN